MAQARVEHDIPEDDDVLAALRAAEEQYRDVRSELDRHRDHLSSAHDELDRTRRSHERLERRIKTAQNKLQQERRRAKREQERADRLAELLKDVHRSLFAGNTYELILEACIKITGATRGLYVTTRGTQDRMRVRAAVDVDGYPHELPSDFLQALCASVVEEQEPRAWTREELWDGLPRPAREHEQFNNCIVAPVVLLQDMNGVVVVADKMHGEFDDDDARAILSIGGQAAVAVENVRLRRALQRAYADTVAVLADAMEAKDPYTQGHCSEVSRLTRRVTRLLGLAPAEQSVVCYAALLHDIGKIAVSDGVLNKRGPLLPEERELVKSHVRVGYNLLVTVPALNRVAEIVLHHHEWYDGNGYPDGLRGEDIPIGARILCVVDSYCAMLSARSYKDAYSEAQARGELLRCAGTQFDPRVVDMLLAALDCPDDLDAEDAECGVLPTFDHIRAWQRAIQ